jgi:hypothetical protein
MSWTICEVKYRPVGKLRSYKISESLDTAQRSSFKVRTTSAAIGGPVRSFNLDRETRLAVQPVDAIWSLGNVLSIQHFGDDCF